MCPCNSKQHHLLSGCRIHLNSRLISYHISFQLVGSGDIVLPVSAHLGRVACYWTSTALFRRLNMLPILHLQGEKESFPILLDKFVATFYRMVWKTTAIKLNLEKYLQLMILLFSEKLTLLAKVFMQKHPSEWRILCVSCGAFSSVWWRRGWALSQLQRKTTCLSLYCT